MKLFFHRLTISSVASFMAVNDKTKTSGKIVVTGANELI